jgi:hypothetical protein
MSSILADQKRPRTVYEPKCGGGIPGSQPMSSAVHRGQNKLWRSNSIFNLWSEAGVLKNLSLAGLAKLSRQRFGWPQPALVDSESTIGRCTQPDTQYEIPGVNPLSLAERG